MQVEMAENAGLTNAGVHTMSHSESTSFDPDELVTVYTAREPTLAELIRNELQAEGIPCEVSGENQAGLAGVLKIDLLVRARDAERARTFIEEHEGRLS
jgi:hypothetical protein